MSDSRTDPRVFSLGKKEKIGIALIIVISIGAVLSWLYSQPAVSVNVQPADIEIKQFDPENPPAEVAQEASKIVYRFPCDVDLDYQLEASSNSKASYQAEIKITRARLVLNLPIVVHLSKKARPGTDNFEKGHVLIAKRVYYEARNPAKLAAQGIIGRSFHGVGATSQLAEKNAITIATNEIKEQYVQSIRSKMTAVQSIYDFFAQSGSESCIDLVDKAFHHYELGKTRRLSPAR